MKLVVGIDIGGTKTKIGLVNQAGECLTQLFFRTREYPDLQDYLQQIKKSVDQLLEEFGPEAELLGCGIGAPNASSRQRNH